MAGLVLGVLGLAPDLDHFLALGDMLLCMRGVELGVDPTDGMRWLHNGYALVIAPVLLFVATSVFEMSSGRHRSLARRGALALLAVLTGHLALDLAVGSALPLGYPFDSGTFAVSAGSIMALDGAALMSIRDIPLLTWGVGAVILFLLCEAIYSHNEWAVSKAVEHHIPERSSLRGASQSYRSLAFNGTLIDGYYYAGPLLDGQRVNLLEP